MLSFDRQGVVTCLISEDGRQFGSFTVLERSPCVLDGVEYVFTREKSDRYWLEGPTGVLGIAHRSTRDELLVSAAPHEMIVRCHGTFVKKWALHEGGRVHGPGRFKTTRGTWDLPAHLPLPLRMFVLYIGLTYDITPGTYLRLWP